MTPESTKFMWIVQALAQPADVQLKLYPSFAEPADELAQEHEEAQDSLLASVVGQSLGPRQRQAVTALDELLQAMSDLDDLSLWTDEAIERRTEWREVRAAARIVLASFDWPDEPPPQDRGDIFIAGPEED